jgi:hypothetical protein
MTDEELKALLAEMEERLMRRLEELESDMRDLGIEVARLARPETKS